MIIAVLVAENPLEVHIQVNVTVHFSFYDCFHPLSLNLMSTSGECGITCANHGGD